MCGCANKEIRSFIETFIAVINIFNQLFDNNKIITYLESAHQQIRTSAH